jgi:arabinoxylan arabinofuranohydrolase
MAKAQIRSWVLCVLAACVVAAFPFGARADNPIVQTLYTADPAPYVYDGRVYLYTTHDEDTLVNNFFTMNDWRVYSSTDIVNWTDHGSPLRYSDFTWARGDAWAGQVISRGGKFYFYVPVTSSSLGRHVIGVGVSDSPIGPFRDAIGRPLITDNCGDIDPTVYVDDDGQAYLYWGNPNLCYVRLNQDMISYQGSVVRVPMTTASFGTRSNTERPTTYEEGPWLYKRNSLYYLVFAAGPISEHIGYSTSSSPTGPWVYRGVVMPTQGASFTNHPGVIDYMGGSYFFYHNGALPGGGGFHRSVGVERFTYNADGTIPRLNMTTQGPPQIGTLNPYVQTEAETIAWEAGIETERCSEGGMNVTAISNGDSIKVKGVNFGTGAVSFDARVASAGSGGNIELRLDSLTGTLVGTCGIQGTGGAQTWMTRTCTVSGATGTHDLFLRFTGGSGASLFNFNWWKFTPRDPVDGGATDGGAGGGAGGGGGMGGGGTGGTSTAGRGGAAGGASGAAGGASGAAGTGSGGRGGTGPGGSGGQASGIGGMGGGTGGAAGTGGGAGTAGAGGGAGGTLGNGGSSAAAGRGGGAGTATGGSGADAGTSGTAGQSGAAGGAGEVTSGCSCQSSPGGRGTPALALLLVAAFMRRRSALSRPTSGSPVERHRD